MSRHVPASVVLTVVALVAAGCVASPGVDEGRTSPAGTTEVSLTELVLHVRGMT